MDASGSGTKNDVDGRNLKLENQSLLEGQDSEIKGEEDEEKENLLEYCLTTRDVYRLFIAANDAIYSPFASTSKSPLCFEDEDGKQWKINCSHIKQNYVFTKGWRSYIMAKKLRAGDFVFFRQHRTDRSRLFIGFRRRDHGDAASRWLDDVLPSQTSSETMSVESCSDLQECDNVHPGPTSLDPLFSDCDAFPKYWGYVPFSDPTSLDSLFSDCDAFPKDWGYVPSSDPTSLPILPSYIVSDILPYSSSPMTSSETLKLREEHKEVVTPPRLTLPEHSITPGYDHIFVIFSGDNQDTEETYFISYIVGELCLRGFTPFRYDISRSSVAGNQEMLHRSQFGIMIVSKNYARSRECLDGFVAIMDHLKTSNIITVFSEDTHAYRYSHNRAFSQLGNSVQPSKVLKWKRAMKELTYSNRYHYMKGSEVMLAKNIVKDVCSLVKSETNNNLTERKLQLKSILRLLNCSQSPAPNIVGLWGMAGIGKTTIAIEIFRTQAESYDVCYFLPDFHLICQTKGLSYLRDEFLSKIFGEEKVFIDACDTNLSFRRDWFFDKRVLIVLDDVTNARDVEVIVGGFDWFSGGHTIVLTSRNRQVLVQCKAKELYEIPVLSEPESFRLCCQYGTEQHWKRRISLISELVNYTSGIPLALRVLGSSIQKQCNDEKQLLRRLRQHPPKEIQDAFRRSFDGLDENEKMIFLDLACFFREENKDHVVNILDSCGFLTDLGIYGLIDESLISLVDNRIEMPNIFQDTGRFVVSQEHKEPGNRSRLWDSNDIADVLTNNSGTEAIEGIFLDASGLTFELNPTVFERMYRLRLLKLHCPTSENHCKICLPQGLHSLPDELRLLHWERYPLGSLPRNFNPKNLVELNMPYSNMTKLWKGTKNLKKLQRIILKHSRLFSKFPRLSEARNLEHIDLEGCTSLVKVNSSILHHQKLNFLSLKDCSQLQIMPTTVHLESLEVLNLSGCSELKNLQDFSPNLKHLYLAGTAITEMPSSIGNLTRLVTLDLENCKRLQHLPPGISNLKAMVTLKLSGCSNLKSLPNLDALLLRDSKRPNTNVTTEESGPLKFRSAIQESRSDGSEILLNLDSLKLRSDIQGSSFSSDVEVFLPASDYLSSDGIPQEIWPRVINIPFTSSVLHSLASRLYALVSLYLCNAYLVDIPEEICQLALVKTLDLSGNPFSQIPKSIKELCKLHSLRLRHCKNLRSLPELPGSLEFLNAHGCESLISFNSGFEKFPRHCTFSNCFALAPTVMRKSIVEALEGFRQEPSNPPYFSICIPALRCQESLHTLQAGSSVRIVLTPDMRNTTSGFVLSVLVEFWENYSNAAGFGIKCICQNIKGELSSRLERIFYCLAPKEAPTIQKDHMFVFSVVKMHDFLADVVSFEFLPVDWENKHLDDSCRVKRCGVWKIPTTTYDTILGIKRPYSVEPSSVGQMSPSFKRYQLMRDTETVIPTSKRKQETDVCVADRGLDERDRQRRVLINGRLKKLQEVVPNMGKRTNSADVLDAAVDYIEDLEREYKILKENRANCKCMNKEKKAM